MQGHSRPAWAGLLGDGAMPLVQGDLVAVLQQLESRGYADDPGTDDR